MAACEESERCIGREAHRPRWRDRGGGRCRARCPPSGSSAPPAPPATRRSSAPRAAQTPAARAHASRKQRASRATAVILQEDVMWILCPAMTSEQHSPSHSCEDSKGCLMSTEYPRLRFELLGRGAKRPQALTAHPQCIQRARVPRRRQQAVGRQVLLLPADRDQQVDRHLGRLRRRVLRKRVHEVHHQQLRACACTKLDEAHRPLTVHVANSIHRHGVMRRCITQGLGD